MQPNENFQPQTTTTTNPSVVSTPTSQDIQKSKKNPLILLGILSLLVALVFGGFFMLKNFGKNQNFSELTTDEANKILFETQKNLIGKIESISDIEKFSKNINGKFSIFFASNEDNGSKDELVLSLGAENLNSYFDKKKSIGKLQGGINLQTSGSMKGFGFDEIWDIKEKLKGNWTANSGEIIFNIAGSDLSYSGTSGKENSQQSLENYYSKLAIYSNEIFKKNFLNKNISYNGDQFLSYNQIFSTKNENNPLTLLKQKPIFETNSSGNRIVLQLRDFSNQEKKEFDQLTESLPIFGLLQAQASARDSARKVGLNQIGAGLEIYYNYEGTYPQYETLTNVKELKNSLNDLIYDIPKDPQSSKTWYYRSFGNSGFVLLVNVENERNSNSQDFGASGNIYVIGSAGIDKQILTQFLNSKEVKNISIVQKSQKQQFYIDAVAKNTYKISPVWNENLGLSQQDNEKNYIIFDTKNIKEFGIFSSLENKKIDISLKDQNLVGNIINKNSDGTETKVLINGVVKNWDNVKIKVENFEARDGKQDLAANADIDFSNTSGVRNYNFSLNFDPKIVGKITIKSNFFVKDIKDENLSMPKADMKFVDFAKKFEELIKNDSRIKKLEIEREKLYTTTVVTTVGNGKAVNSNSLIDLKQVKTALEMYYSENGNYPAAEKFVDISSFQKELGSIISSLPKNILYKSLELKGIKNGCYVIKITSNTKNLDNISLSEIREYKLRSNDNSIEVCNN